MHLAIFDFPEADAAGGATPGVVDSATVDCGLIVKLAILGNDLVGRRDRGVGFVEPKIEKEGLVGFALFIEPSDGFIDDDLTGVAFYLSQAFAIAQKLGWVLVAGARTVDETKPIVEAMIAGSGVVAIVYGHA